MSVAAWMAAQVLVAAVAFGCLWRASVSAEPSVNSAHQWLATVAIVWGGSFAVGEALPGHGLAASLTIGGLLALAALAVLCAAVAALARASQPPSPAAGRPLGRGAGPALTQLADGCLVALALFVVGWAAFYGSAYHKAGVSAGGFALDLLHPVTDLVLLGAIMAYLGASWRRSLLPWLALLAVTLADSLAAPARISGVRPGLGTELAQLAALALLAACALPRDRVDRLLAAARASRAWPGASTATAAAATVAAALTTIGWAAGGGSVTDPVVVITGGLAALVLVARVAGVAWYERAATQAWQESGRAFLELAERTSDVVVLCDLAAIVRYASPAVARFGYRPEAIEGTPLSALIHPEDRLRGARVIRSATLGPPGQTTHFSCRIRSADGTWHHLESSLARYREAGGDNLLITARDVSDQVALRRQVTHLTFHDGLTGLPNRAYIEERAKSAAQRAAAGRAQGAQDAAIFIDLDGFTGVNDSVGHGAGDLLLAQAARRLRNVVPAQHTVARWGGDEFAVLVESGANAQETVDIAERLAGAIAGEPFRVAGRDISLTGSIGVALAGSNPPEHLLRNADVAMARAKVAGGRVEIFNAQMHADVVRRLELASELRRAITDEELELEYQPVVELATSRVVGVEALVRWTSGETVVPPAEFLSVAEESGLIGALGEQVLRAACAQAAAWHASGWPTGISVNFSLRQVSREGFADLVLGVLAETGLPPAALTLEVTERVLVDGAAVIVDALARLRRHGVRLAIDDFGTGYASLAYLRQLPVDIIKIDPSFVAGLGTDATLAMLTATIVRVGRDLGIAVVAEGIEQPEQLEMLRGMGCGLGQGFLVARPMGARGIEVFAGPMPGGTAGEPVPEAVAAPEAAAAG